MRFVFPSSVCSAYRVNDPTLIPRMLKFVDVFIYFLKTKFNIVGNNLFKNMAILRKKLVNF